jgi:xylulose-5-phosphate/fructose-6-phosphate phosphoketolase
MDTLDRIPKTFGDGAKLKQILEAKLIEHKKYIDENGIDMPEIRDWKWSVSP